MRIYWQGNIQQPSQVKASHVFSEFSIYLQPEYSHVAHLHRGYRFLSDCWLNWLDDI